MSIFDTTKRAFGSGYDDYDNYDGYDDEMYDNEYADEKPQKKSFFSFFSRKKESDSYDDGYDYEEDRERSERDSRDYRSRDYGSRSYSGSRSTYSSYSGEAASSRSASSRSSIRYAPSPSDIEVKVLYPTNFDGSSEIVREVKAGKITIFDVSGIPSNDEARRVVDYISGAAAGMECPFSRLCPSIFCIAPKGVRLSNANSRYKT